MAAPHVAGAIALLHERSLAASGYHLAPTNARAELISGTTKNVVTNALSTNNRLLYDFLPAGQAPVADVSYTSSGLTADFFDASSDPNGRVVAWAWDFAGQGQSSQQNPSYTFPASGTNYSVGLVVTDNQGYVGFIAKPVSVSDGGTVFQLSRINQSLPNTFTFPVANTVMIPNTPSLPVANTVMIRTSSILALVIPLLLALSTGCSSYSEDGYVPGEVLAQFQVDTSVEEARIAIEAEGAEWGGVVNPYGAEIEGALVLARVPVGAEREWVDRLSNLPGVVRAFLNQTVQPY
jgi:hypothetical protein